MKSTVSIPPVSSSVASDSDRRRYVVAWLLCLIFYSMEYASRSSPSVMVPELGKAFGTTAVGVAALSTCLDIEFAWALFAVAHFVRIRRAS